MEENRRRYRSYIDNAKEVLDSDSKTAKKEAFMLYEQAVQCAKNIYIETGLLKDKVALIDAYMNKAFLEEQMDDEKAMDNSYLTYQRAKRLIDELLIKNNQLHYQRLFIKCASAIVRVSITLNKKKIAKQLLWQSFKLSKKIYKQTELVDDMKPLMYVYCLCGDWCNHFLSKIIARYFYYKVIKEMEVLYSSMHETGMYYDIISLYDKIIETYGNKITNSKKKWEIKQAKFKEDVHGNI